jgi:uncharacterized membrane protein
VLLFVSAHWDALSPSWRFGVVLVLVAFFHAAASALHDRFPALTPVLHVLGTVGLGAGIYMTGQIFNLAEHWPGGVMLWALGAALAFLLLRDPGHAVLTVILVPAWLVCEGVEAGGAMPADSMGVLLLALACFTAPLRRAPSAWNALRITGAIVLLPAALAFAIEIVDADRSSDTQVMTIAWLLTLGLPLLLALTASRRDWWKWAAAAAWTLIFAILPGTHEHHGVAYLWAAGLACWLAWWGVADRRPERVNLAVAGFALTVLFFYFDNVMDKMGRSASLLGLGVLFLVGGWLLERARRRMLERVREVGA